jgi:hypothetical protein
VESAMQLDGAVLILQQHSEARILISTAFFEMIDRAIGRSAQLVMVLACSQRLRRRPFPRLRSPPDLLQSNASSVPSAVSLWVNPTQMRSSGISLAACTRKNLQRAATVAA